MSKILAVTLALINFISFFGSVALVVAVGADPQATLYLSIAIAAVSISFASPRTAITAGLVALPLAGNRPSTEHALIGFLIAAGIYIGLTLRRFISKPQEVRLLNNSTIVFAVLYVLASILSLSSMPWPLVVAELDNVGIRSFPRVTEHSLLYPLLSVYLTCLSASFGLVIFTMAKACSRERLLFSAAVLIGLLASLIFGLLDYYGIVSLSFYRELDPIVNPGGRQFRLQSFFAHSGWFAEYLTLTIPFALVLLSLKWRFRYRVLLILISVVVGELALILSYQRGGWLSYPITLVAVWAAIYATYRLERGEGSILAAVKSSFLKVLISLPLTVLISLALVSYLKPESSSETISPYMQRFKDISKTSDRLDFFYAGSLVGLKHPFYGAGSESFAVEFEREFEDPQGSYFQKYVLPLHGSAHNVYAQTFSGKGIVGLFLLLACCFSLISNLRYLKYEQELLSSEQKLSIITGAAFSVAFLIYGNVQEVFYVQPLQFLFFAAIGLFASAVPEFENNNRLFKNLASGMIAIFFLHMIWEFVYPGQSISRWNTPVSKPCYSPEMDSAGEEFRWCGPKSFMSIKLSEGEVVDGLLTLHISKAKELSKRSMSVKINTGGYLEDIDLEQDDVRLDIPVPEAVGGVVISFQASSHFIPAKHFKNNHDHRTLSFKVRKP